MKPGDIIRTRAEYHNIVSNIKTGFVAGVVNILDSKIIIWSDGSCNLLQRWQENYYEVVSEDDKISLC